MPKRSGAILAALLLAASTATLALAQTTEDARAISEDIFGSSVPPDEAFGAFQRGYYLTALSLALPRAEKGDGAAQTLIGEIYS